MSAARPPDDPPEVWAGGAVLWRRGDGCVPEVALVHRPRYDDWSLPKGKLDPGEHLLSCAAREVEEETGFRAALGRPLGEQRYPVTTRTGRPATKVVRYWAARALDGEFTPNEEVDELVWLPAPEVGGRLTHPRDREFVDRLLECPDTATVVVVRHAHAGSREAWDADDRLRPLDAAGHDEARASCAVLPVFGPERVLSADLVRCVDTVRPLAERLGVPVELEPALGEAAYAEDPERTVRRFDDILAAGQSLVVCSQGGVVPGLLAAVAARDGVPLGAAGEDGRAVSRKGSAWALSVHAGRLVDAEYFPRLTA